jgi:hypothetical protein
VKNVDLFCFKKKLLILFWKGRSTVEVTGLREGGDVRGCLLAAIMILDYDYEMHTYLRYAKHLCTYYASGQQHAL